MARAQVLTSWVGSGVSTQDARRPKIVDDFSLLSLEDVTGQAAAQLPPSPNLVVVEITCTDAVLAAIETADPAAVLWSDAT